MVEQELRDVEKALAPSKICYLDGTMSKILRGRACLDLDRRCHAHTLQALAIDIFDSKQHQAASDPSVLGDGLRQELLRGVSTFRFQNTRTHSFAH
jgi:hypothetical protein